jgi:cyclase
MFLPLLIPFAVVARNHPAPRKIQVADGIFVFITAPYSDVGLDGNSVVVLSSDGVLVFDSNGTPAAAAAVLGEIRKLTDQPVRYLVNSHWHWDHWYGAQVYREAFPGIQIISHVKTREMELGPALAFNQPVVDVQLPQHIREIESRLATATPGSPERERLQRHLDDDGFFLDQKRGVRHTVANLTFSDSLTIYLGDREIRVLHYDRAVTPGDAFLYLPKEKIVVTGDLLVNPISFALSSYPSGWLATLERIGGLDASVVIPGHGEPLHDKVLLQTHIAIFRELLRQGRAAKAKGLTVQQAEAAALPAVHDLMVTLTHNDPGLNQQFGIYLVDWYLRRVYDELDEPLSDAIAPIP